ncbi:MAG: sulfatase-like hydrolase/transferase [Myxococcales bacterium]|nr:sulfatase-like hydrolase/transferase [Myxococcales bacterium]
MSPLPPRPSTATLGFRISSSFWAAVVAAGIYGAVEALLRGDGETLWWTVSYNAGLMSLVAVPVAVVVLAGLRLLLGPLGWSPRQWFAALRDSTEVSRRSLLSYALLGPVIAGGWFAFTYHVVRVAMGKFVHMGLAALLCTAGTLLVAVLGVLLLRRSCPWLASRWPARWVRERFVPVFFGLLALHLFLLGLSIALSSEAGEGLWGFWGLLKREALDLSFLWPLLWMVAAILLGLCVPAPTPKWQVARLSLLLVVGICVGGFVRAITGLNHCAPCTVQLETQTAITHRTLSLLRRTFDADGDGFSPYFGGGDCDDTRADVHPGAIDIPGDGIDQDCSGADAVQRATVERATEAPVPAVSDHPALDPALSLLFISVDALRHDLGFTGYARNISPNIDALAQEGVVFTHAWSLSSFTGRAIGPMLIGRYPTETFCNASHLSRYSDKNRLLAEMLHDAGLQTGSVQAHPYFARSGLQQGFDRFEIVAGRGGDEPDLRITGDQSTAAAVRWLNDDTFTAGRFFLWVHYMDPHKEYLAHKEFSVFGSDSRARYDGEVAFTDAQIGELLAALSARGLRDRTAVMLTADHGEAFGEHNIRFHGRALWDEIMRVPWIFRVPGLAPQRIATPVGHIDLVPTVLDLLSLPAEPQLRGKSLLPIMRQGSGTPDPIYIEQPEGEYMPPMNALIAWPYKLIHTITGNRFQLFHLGDDPGEQTDLSRTHPDVLEDMKAQYNHQRAAIEYTAERYQRR